jgi:hypothetical protein
LEDVVDPPGGGAGGDAAVAAVVAAAAGVTAVAVRCETLELPQAAVRAAAPATEARRSRREVIVMVILSNRIR